MLIWRRVLEIYFNMRTASAYVLPVLRQELWFLLFELQTAGVVVTGHPYPNKV